MSKFETKKIFRWSNLPRDLEDAAAIHANELYNLGNDSYMPWHIGIDKYSDYFSLSEDDQRAIDKWLLDNGAEPRESVLIFISW